MRYRKNRPIDLNVTVTRDSSPDTSSSSSYSSDESPRKEIAPSKHPETPYFYQSRESLLESLPIFQSSSSPQGKYERNQYEGFLNLSIIMLMGACAILSIDNFLHGGILVDFELLKCMTGDVQRSFMSMLIIIAYVLFIFLLSQINMRIIYRAVVDEQGKGSCKSVMLLRQVLHQICILIYIVSLVITFYIILALIFWLRLSILVSFMVTVSLMIYTMKMHSYYVYILRYFCPNVSQKDDHVAFVSISEFAYFLVAPTMCFFRYYPRTDSIRITYILKQVGQFMFCLSAMYILCLQYLDPVFKLTVHLDSNIKIAYLVLKVSIPWFIIWLLGSYAIFHCYLNIIAEITKFGDRLWYRDWWNAPSFDKFWRTWNIPTHHWLLRHVYLQTIRFKVSKSLAVWITFAMSAVIHELCMSMVFRTVRYYFFLAMVLQVPFVILAEKYKTKSERLGNCLMWMSLFMGQPLMLLLYFKDWYSHERAMCDMRYQ